MSHESVLAHLYLEAVLPCLEALTEQDDTARALACRWNGRIRLSTGMRGPACTIELKGGRAQVTPSRLRRPDIALFFPGPSVLNNLFRGTGLRVALPWRGITKIRGLLAFSRLADRLQEVLDGHTAHTDLRAELTLGLMTRALAVIAGMDPGFREHAAKLRGVAEFSVSDAFAAHVDFSGPAPRAYPGRAASPDFILGFRDSPLFLAVAEDRVDVVAKACLGEITLKGDLHMGQVITVALDRIGRYLQQEAPHAV